jgi:RNA polymerase sigma-70 factor, ECF subfamily
MSKNRRTFVGATNGVGPSAAQTGFRADSHSHDWVAIVDRIQAGQDAGILELYSVLNRGIRYYLGRQLGSQDLEDRLHETFLIVISAIRAGRVRQPERIMGFVRTVAQRQIAAHIELAVRHRRTEGELAPGLDVADEKCTPEQMAIIRQKAEIMALVLADMPAKQREILQRYYLREESPEHICQEMLLTETQFRLAKSRAKTALGARAQLLLRQRTACVVKVPSSTGLAECSGLVAN